ncbi:hypothetical protein DE146DRAFT_723208 [Phaeosphaeria sp. MPI-PUGE-AT-0046c]|nr:hypothetical protein DE146DRAFT_723208 [Phaeosphaeria sp. MPI-PUGE-AT-0046c]
MSYTKAQRTAGEKAMNSAREKSMKTFEDLYSEPPPYSSRPPSRDTTACNHRTSPRNLPHVAELNFQPSPLEIPTPAECIAHLKLLHAFAKLRQDVGNREGLFGVNVKDCGSDETNLPGDEGLAERLREKRWTIFVTKAVARFEKWWDHLYLTSTWDRPIATTTFENASDSIRAVQMFPIRGYGYESSDGFRLPPLDVLMVWHAYMLNPRIYLEDSVRFTKQTLWRTKFPWELIYSSLDNETFEYRPEDTRHFEQTTKHPWDPLIDETPAFVKCPLCCRVNEVAWTLPPLQSSKPGVLEVYLADDTGFSASGFTHNCSSCEFRITHEKMRVGKFCDDADDLLELQRPLAGTILNSWGEPTGTTSGKKIGTHDAFFPHRVIEAKPDFKPDFLRGQIHKLSIDALKVKFEHLMRSRKDVEDVNSQQKYPSFIAKSSRIAVRKVLSHYWDNSSVFGIDLVGAILRQGTFVQKMVKLDWLHSPNLMSTVQRLIVKYHRFVRLAAENPGKTVVPTLDVDLAWHTHQLTPKSYYIYTMAETKKFLNHDDKIGESSLHYSFSWTSAAYEKKYAQPYSECACWYCECTREPLRSSFLSKLSSRTSSLSINALESKGFTKDAHAGPHVSAHNAFDAKTPAQRRKDLEVLDLQYAKVCKRYNKQKAAKAPRRDDRDAAYVYGAYGYPIYYPVYVPYYADAGSCEYASVGSAGQGSCATGTCCNSASMGSCAGGFGTPGCSASCGGHGSAEGGCGTCSAGDGGGGGGDGGGGGCGGGG